MPEGFSTDSYPKASLPVQQSPLDIAGKLGSMQQQAINIDKAKLDLMNTHFGLVNQELSTIIGDKSTTPEQAVQRLTTFGKMINLPAPVMQKMIGEFQGLKTPEDVQKQAQLTLMRGMDIQQKINLAAGQGGLVDTGQGLAPIVTQSPLRGGAVTRAPGYIQKQVPVTAETVDSEQFLPDGSPNPNYGQRRLYGPQPEQSVQPSLPAQRPSAPAQQPSMLPPGPVTDKRVLGPSSNFGGNIVSVVAEPPTFRDRFDAAFKPRGPATGLAPGEAEAFQEVAGQSGKQMALDRQSAATFQREILPLNQAIPALEKLGTKGTGPGTETLNQIKSFILSNVPGVKESDFNGTVGDYDKAKKYLTDFVNQTGSSGTNDKLAAAFAGNPSVHISNAAAVDVAKTALALRRMKQAQLIEADKANVSPAQYSKWASQWNNRQDPRAFGFDMMDKDKAKKMIEKMTPEEKAIFARSLRIAHDAKLTNTAQDQ